MTTTFHLGEKRVIFSLFQWRSGEVATRQSAKLLCRGSIPLYALVVFSWLFCFQQLLDALAVLLAQVRRESNLGEYAHSRVLFNVFLEFRSQTIGEKERDTLAFFRKDREQNVCALEIA